jgi:uncharacterized protein YlxW (UPF0749 family)
MWAEIEGPAIRIIEATGPTGAIVAAVLVALALVVIILAKFGGLFDNSRNEVLKTDFIGRLVAEVDKFSEREKELRREADRLEAENDRLKDKMRELQTQGILMRNQLRRAIDLLRAVREGRMSPDAIAAADTIEVVS